MKILFTEDDDLMRTSLTFLTEEFTFHQYPRIKDYFKLLFVALLEPFFFHPFVVYSALKGHWEKFKGVKSWGEMTRGGFTKS